MNLPVDLLSIVLGIAGLVAGYTLADRNKSPVVTDQDLKHDLEYYRNLSDSLRQDVTDLRKKNNDLMEKNWQLTLNKENQNGNKKISR